MKLSSKALICALVGGAMLTIHLNAKAQSNDDKKFIAKAAQENLNDIKFSKLAETKATHPAEKALAHKIVVEDTRIDRSMKPYLESWSVTPATNLDEYGQKEYDKLNGLSGSDFDKEYIDRTVSDLGTELDNFTSEAKDTKDVKFRSTVIRDKTMVAAHKNMAYNLKKKM